MDLNTVCEAHAGNSYAIDLVYNNYKPLVELFVRRRRLVFRRNDYSVSFNDVVQEIWFESMNNAINNFNMKRFMNSKKNNIDHFFWTSINYSIDKWLKLHTKCWRNIPNIIDNSDSYKKLLRTDIVSLASFAVVDKAGSKHLVDIDVASDRNLVSDDSNFKYEALNFMILDQINAIFDKIKARKSKGYSSAVYDMTKENIEAIFNMRLSGYIYKDIADKSGFMLKDINYLFLLVIMPAVLLVLDLLVYYRRYKSNIGKVGLNTIKNEKGSIFVDNIVSMV